MTKNILLYCNKYQGHTISPFIVLSTSVNTNTWWLNQTVITGPTQVNVYLFKDLMHCETVTTVAQGLLQLSLLVPIMAPTALANIRRMDPQDINKSNYDWHGWLCSQELALAYTKLISVLRRRSGHLLSVSTHIHREIPTARTNTVRERKHIQCTHSGWFEVSSWQMTSMSL